MFLTLAPGVTLPEKLVALLGGFDDGWSYGLGWKIQPLSLQAPDLIGIYPLSGAQGKQVDCSGMSRWLIYHLTGGVTVIPDGSTNQRGWVEGLGRPNLEGFQEVPVADGHQINGVLYIAFLSPTQTNEHIGHVLLLCNGVTYESHGGPGEKGPDSREWGSEPFMAEMSVYQMTN